MHLFHSFSIEMGGWKGVPLGPEEKKKKKKKERKKKIDSIMFLL